MKTIVQKIADDINNIPRIKSKYVYTLTCETCSQYKKINNLNKNSNIVGYCQNGLGWIINNKEACLYCDFNRANLNYFQIIKLKINNGIKNTNSLFLRFRNNFFM